MGSIENFTYPEIKVDMAIKSVKLFKEKLGGKATTSDSLAGVWNQSPKSGAFLQKLADLRRYGLISTRGLELTELGEKVANPLNPSELTEAITTMILGIDLWKNIYNRLKGKPASQDFWIILHEVTGADREVAKKEADKISRVYIDAISKVRIGNDSMMPSQLQHMSEITPSHNLIEVKSGDVYLKLPRTNANIDLIKDALESLKEKSKEKK